MKYDRILCFYQHLSACLTLKGQRSAADSHRMIFYVQVREILKGMEFDLQHYSFIFM